MTNYTGVLTDVQVLLKNMLPTDSKHMKHSTSAAAEIRNWIYSESSLGGTWTDPTKRIRSRQKNDMQTRLAKLEKENAQLMAYVRQHMKSNKT